MFKLLGGAVIILSFGLMGMKKYTEIYERKRILQNIQSGAEKIKNNLRCMCMPLYECFLFSGEFFENAGRNMENGLMPSEAVKDTAQSYHFLNKEDKEVIERFADGLSAQDCDGQIANIELFLKETEKLIEHASKELMTKGTIFLKGSLLGGAALVLLLI